jgi:hypothetical protein
MKTEDQALYSIFFEESLKLVTESKNLRAIGMPGEVCTSCSIGTGTKGAWYGAREEAQRNRSAQNTQGSP